MFKTIICSSTLVIASLLVASPALAQTAPYCASSFAGGCPGGCPDAGDVDDGSNPVALPKIECEEGAVFSVEVDDPYLGGFLDVSARPGPLTHTTENLQGVWMTPGYDEVLPGYSRELTPQLASQPIELACRLEASLLPPDSPPNTTKLFFRYLPTADNLGQHEITFTLGYPGFEPGDETNAECSFLINVRDSNSDDVDGDGVPNDQDLCEDTGHQDLVDANGCSIAQECDCDDNWCRPSSYLRCVSHVTAQMLWNGTMTWGERSDALDAAYDSDCGKDNYASWIDILTGQCNAGYGFE